MCQRSFPLSPSRGGSSKCWAKKTNAPTGSISGRTSLALFPANQLVVGRLIPSWCGRACALSGPCKGLEEHILAVKQSSVPALAKAGNLQGFSIQGPAIRLPLRNPFLQHSQGSRLHRTREPTHFSAPELYGFGQRAGRTARFRVGRRGGMGFLHGLRGFTPAQAYAMPAELQQRLERNCDPLEPS